MIKTESHRQREHLFPSMLHWDISLTWFWKKQSKNKVIPAESLTEALPALSPRIQADFNIKEANWHQVK